MSENKTELVYLILFLNTLWRIIVNLSTIIRIVTIVNRIVEECKSVFTVESKCCHLLVKECNDNNRVGGGGRGLTLFGQDGHADARVAELDEGRVPGPPVLLPDEEDIFGTDIPVGQAFLLLHTTTEKEKGG